MILALTRPPAKSRMSEASECADCLVRTADMTELPPPQRTARAPISCNRGTMPRTINGAFSRISSSHPLPIMAFPRNASMVSARAHQKKASGTNRFPSVNEFSAFPRPGQARTFLRTHRRPAHLTLGQPSAREPPDGLVPATQPRGPSRVSKTPASPLGTIPSSRPHDEQKENIASREQSSVDIQPLIENLQLAEPFPGSPRISHLRQDGADWAPGQLCASFAADGGEGSPVQAAGRGSVPDASRPTPQLVRGLADPAIVNGSPAGPRPHRFR